jgi:ribosomal protein S8
MTPKIKRRWIKEEKRIVYLLYRKGFLKDFKVCDLYWEEYRWHDRKLYKGRENKYDGKRYKYPIYLPEVHYSTSDYWGETDEHSVVSHVLEELYWRHIDTTDWDPDSGVFPRSTFKKISRVQFIYYLKKLPTVVPNKEINKILKKRSMIN